MVYSRAVPTRSAIVTGGGTGIGAAIPDRLSADGYAFTVMGRRAEPLDAVVEQLGEGLAVTGDVGRPEDCEPDASYVNGVTLPADGGASIYDPTSAAFADPA